MQRQDTQWTFGHILRGLTCFNSAPEQLSDEQVLLLNPSEPDLFSDEERVSNDAKASDIKDDSTQGPCISTNIDCEFYSEVGEELSKCDNVVCCSGLCTVGLCACGGLVAGCTPVLLMPAATVATLTPTMQSVMLVLVPFGSMFAGYGAGALCWGQSTEAAQRWVSKRTEQNRSTSVCGFFGSYCEPAEEQRETPLIPMRMQR